MDDSELDRLFGEDGKSDEGALNGDNGASAEDSAKTASGDNENTERDEDENPFELLAEEESGDTEEKSEEVESDGDTDEGEDAPEEDSEENIGEDSGEEDEESGKEKESPVRNRDNAVNRTPRTVRRERPVKQAAPSDDGSLLDFIRQNRKGVIAACLAVAVIIMILLVVFLPAFRVRNAHVEGNVVLTDQEVLKEVGLEYDSHLMSGVSGNIFDILRLNYGKTEERVKQENPYIEDIRISVKLPSTVDIRIKERRKVCYIRTPDGYAALDEDGIVLELSSFDAKRTVRPVICGLNVKYAELGKPVKISNMNDYKKAIIVLGAILAADNASVGGDYSMFENTSEVRILPSGYIFLTVYLPSGNLIQIKLNGTDNIGDHMAWLLYASNSNSLDKLTADGSLDMTGDEYIFDEY
ncbi:FtsQ-type POTRA domain-containing protein [Butyrivibrio sp. AE2032]|uniref:FtsQ-type POTRA domain-containing protein n=1 Tax=Butyrivibrio sp. AE2032 TaxID=1458463 RepID=UPI0005509B9A|nr:FtsQ-type POTRA domain-containing protein [Butyrivibrio sp. AE2032]